MDKHMFIKDAVSYMYHLNGSYKDERVEPYMIVEWDPKRREIIKQTLDYYGFDCLSWGNRDPRVLISLDWRRYSKVVPVPAHFSSKDEREYTICEFMNEILKPFIDAEMEKIPPYTSNRKIIEKSERCACIYCFSRFSSKKITEWAEDEGGDTACCPYCCVDMVIPEPAGKRTPLCYLEKWHKQLLG